MNLRVVRITPACYFFFFNDTATTEIYTLSLHDALPISAGHAERPYRVPRRLPLRRLRHLPRADAGVVRRAHAGRSEEHTSELQSQSNLVCRLLLEKKKTIPNNVPSVCTSQDRLQATDRI